MLDFDLLDKRVFDSKHLNPHRFTSYSLPRQSGTTTYLVNKYNELKSSGFKVLFVAPRQSWLKELSRYPRVNIDTGEEVAGVISIHDGRTFSTILNSLRGTSSTPTGGGYDYILMDNTTYDHIPAGEREVIINTLLTFYCRYTILEINTVE